MRDLPATQQALCYESNPRPNAYMDIMIQRMLEAMVSDQIKSKILETNPFIQIKNCGDKIKIMPLPMDEVYLPKPNKATLTLKDGVYE